MDAVVFFKKKLQIYFVYSFCVEKNDSERQFFCKFIFGFIKLVFTNLELKYYCEQV